MPPVRAGADKWKQRTTAAQRDYVQGVQRPRVSWSAATAAAEETYNAGVQDAISRGAFGKGVQSAGDATWAQGVQTKGAQRYGPGVQASGDKYQQGFAPYAQVITNTQLPPRGRRGDPANIQRVAVMAAALHDAKRSKQGG